MAQDTPIRNFTPITPGPLAYSPTGFSTPVAPDTTTPDPIDGETIGNAKPVKIPNTQTTTASSGLNVASSSVNNIPIPTTPTNTPTGSNTTTDPILQKISDLIGKQGTQGDKTLQYQNEEDIAGKERALTAIDNRIKTTSRAYENEIRRLRENQAGTFGGAVEQNVGIVQRRADQHLADLAIEKSVALGDVDTANKIVDSKIKAEFEPIDNQIKQLQNFYQLNQDDLSESEKVALSAKIENEQAYRDDFLAAKKYAYQLAVESGDMNVLNKISSATSTKGVYSALNGVPGSKGVKGKPTAVQIAMGAQKLQQAKGPDGYIDPAVYQQAYNEWINNGYAPEDFLDKFPPSSWVNPANTTLPVYLRPKGSTAGRAL